MTSPTATVLARSAIQTPANDLHDPPRRLHNVSMPNVLVRDLPEPVHRELERRAKEAGQSLQQFLTTHLSQLVEQPTVEEVFAALEGQSGGRVGFRQAVEDLHAERNR